MKLFSVRGILPACLIAVAALVALVAPGAASASLLPRCEGAQTLEGAGSSLQAEAVEVWAKGFNKSSATTACKGGPGKEPVISYRSIGSGAGFKEWNEHEKFGTVGFVGTDNTINPTEKAELELKGKLQPSGKALTIPVAQGAVAILIDLPNGCRAESTAGKGRLALNQETLAKVYNEEITEWSQITEDSDRYIGTVLAATVTKVKTTEHSTTVTVASGGFPGVVVGDDVIGTGIPLGAKVEAINGNELTLTLAATKTEASDSLKFYTACNTHTVINTAVRKDGSGTTHIFKRFLNWSNSSKLTTSVGNFTWDELSEATKCGGVSCNTLWPGNVGATIKGETGVGMVEEVEKHPSTIGYANLADARNPAFSKFFPPEGGEKKQLFWAVLENKPGTYQDPASNKDVAARATANCKSTEYSNGTASFPPPSVESNWNEVTAKKESKTYPICGLTYDLALGNYAAFGGAAPTPTQGEATTVKNYLEFVLSTATGGGQKEIGEKHDYLALPSNVEKKSEEGLPLIEWE